MSKIKVVYIAGKYRGETPVEVQKNIKHADSFGMSVCAVGAMPLVPHKNTEHYEGLQNDQWFLEGTMELLRRCDAILLIPGWENSVGARGEKAEAERLGLPVFYRIHELDIWLRENE